MTDQNHPDQSLDLQRRIAEIAEMLDRPGGGARAAGPGLTLAAAEAFVSEIEHDRSAREAHLDAARADARSKGRPGGSSADLHNSQDG